MSYRAVVRAVGPSFLVLGLLARLPYAVLPLGTLLLVRSTTGSYAFAGAAAGAQSLAIAVGGVALGALADRLGPRRLGVAAAIVNAGALTVLIVVAYGPRWLIIVAAILSGLTQPQVGPLVRVHWSRLLRARDGQEQVLARALSYEAAADETSFVLGPVVVGLLAVVATGPLMGAAVLLLGAALPFALRYVPGRPGPSSGGIAPAPLPYGRLTALLFAMITVGVVFGAVQTGVAATATDAGRPGTAGVLYAILGLGSATAGLAYGALAPRLGRRRGSLLTALGLVAGTSVLPLSGGVVPLPVSIAVAGLTIAPFMITLYSEAETVAPSGRIASVMTVLCAGGPIGTATGQTVAGVLVDRAGSGAAFIVAPVAAVGALLVTGLRLLVDRGRQEPTTPERSSHVG